MAQPRPKTQSPREKAAPSSGVTDLLGAAVPVNPTEETSSGLGPRIALVAWLVVFGLLSAFILWDLVAALFR
jgi:hypothetical protein